MVSKKLRLSRLDLKKVGGLILALTAASTSATLPRTMLQSSFQEAQAKFQEFRGAAPDLAAILSGKPVQADKVQPEYFSLSVADKASVSLGNAALGLWSERAAPGSGAPWIRESSRLAENDLGLQWLLVLLQLQNGTANTFALQARGLEASMLSQGWSRLPEAASWLLVSADELDAAKQPEKAQLARSVAADLDPISPLPPWIQVKRNLRAFDLTNAYSQAREAYQRILAYPENQQILVFNGLRMLRYTLALTCLLLLLAWVIRYWPFISHGLAERLPRDSSLYLRYAVLALIPVALMVAGLGLVSMCFLAAIVVWKFARRYERILIGMIILFVGFQPLLAGLETTISNHFDQSGTESLYQRSIHEGWSEDLQNRIDKSLSRATHEERGLLNAAKSIQASKLANYTQAFERIHEAHRQSPSDPRIQAALGNQYFLQGNYDTATRIYHKAIQGEWSNGPLLFNLGQSIAWRGRTDSMAKLLANASPIARYRIDVIARQNSNAFQTLPPNRIVMPPEHSPGRMWNHILADFQSHRWSIDRWDLQTGLIDIPPAAILPLSIALIAFLIWWGGRPERRKVLFECRTCGRVMCRVCRKGIHCAQCFRRLSGIEEVDLRNQLLERIQHESDGRRKLLRLAMDLVLPGTGRLMASPSVGAFLQVFLLAACLSYSLNLPNFISLYPISYTLVGQELFVILLVGLYGLGGLQLVRGLGKDATKALKEA
jgi:tetratricopeptide (TPR) repeat protein